MVIRNNGNRIAALVLALAVALLLGACGGGENVAAAGDSAAAGSSAGDAASAPVATDAPKNAGGTVAVDVSGSEPDSAAEAEANPAPEPDADILDIGEKMFVGQMNDIYANTADYIGKQIRYEGFYVCYRPDPATTGGEEVAYHCIVRNGPGCCGYDATVGFEFSWDGEMPQDDDWCRITGTVGTYQENGFDYIVVNASDIEVLPVRGNDTVTQ